MVKEVIKHFFGRSSSELELLFQEKTDKELQELWTYNDNILLAHYETFGNYRRRQARESKNIRNLCFQEIQRRKLR